MQLFLRVKNRLCLKEANLEVIKIGRRSPFEVSLESLGLDDVVRTNVDGDIWLRGTIK